MARCLNCGRQIAPDANPQLCSACSKCETLYDAIVARLKRAVFSGCRFAAILGAAALILRITEPFPASKLISMVLFYLALSEAALSATQFFVSYIQLQRKVRDGQKQ